jgi:hypothetical protein
MIVFALGLSLVSACSDETNAGEPSAGGNAGSGMAGSGMAGGGGAAGGGGTGMMPSGGSGGAAMMADSGAPGGSSGSGQGGSSSNSNCPEIDPVPVPGQTIVIVAINIRDRIVYIQNVSDESIEITGGPGWQWCSLPAYGSLVTSPVTLAPGEIFESSEMVGFSGEVAGAEMAIYDEVSFSDPDRMRAYVVWNMRAEQGREDTAAQAGLWTYLDRATVERGDVGLYATGPTNVASGYTSVPASCFPLAR